MGWLTILTVVLCLMVAERSHAEFHAANLTLMSGQVVALDELYKASNWTCCVPRTVLGDYTPIVRLDSSAGQYYATRDPDCKELIAAADYPATFEAIYMCGRNFSTQAKCRNGGCPAVDGGLHVALPGDWCVDSDNKQDPMVLCSTAAPICDAGYSGKCIALPDNATEPVSDAPSMTLQSGLVVNLQQLQQEYQGQCCLPRSVITDFTPVVRCDNTAGRYFVSNDPSCSGAIPSSMYPAMYEYIWVCGDGCPAGGCYAGNYGPVDGGVTLVPVGGPCNPYDYYTSGCWGAAPMCSFANQCIGINSYNYYWDSNPYGWGLYRPRWWRPLSPIYRPYWRQPSLFHHHPHGWRPGWRPRPADWIPGRPIHGWKPGHRPDNWEPTEGWKPGRGWQPGMHRGGKPVGPVFTPPHRDTTGWDHNHDSLPGTRNGPGIILPFTPGRNTNPNTPGQTDNLEDRPTGSFTPGRGSGTPTAPSVGDTPADSVGGNQIDTSGNGLPSSFTGDSTPAGRGGSSWQGGRPPATDPVEGVPTPSAPTLGTTPLDSVAPEEVNSNPVDPTSRDAGMDTNSNPAGPTVPDQQGDPAVSNLPGGQGDMNLVNPIRDPIDLNQDANSNPGPAGVAQPGDPVTTNPATTPGTMNPSTSRPVTGDWGNLFDPAGRGSTGRTTDAPDVATGGPMTRSSGIGDFSSLTGARGFNLNTPTIPSGTVSPTDLGRASSLGRPSSAAVTQPAVDPTSTLPRGDTPFSATSGNDRPWVLRPAANSGAVNPGAATSGTPFTSGRPAVTDTVSSGFPGSSGWSSRGFNNPATTPAVNSNPVLPTTTSQSFTPRSYQQPSLTPLSTTPGSSSLYSGSSMGRDTYRGTSFERPSSSSWGGSSWGGNSWGSSGSAAPAPLLWQPSSTARPAAAAPSFGRSWGSGVGSSGLGSSGFGGSGFGGRSSGFGGSSLGSSLGSSGLSSSGFGGSGFGSGGGLRGSGGGFGAGRSGLGRRSRRLSAL